MDETILALRDIDIHTPKASAKAMIPKLDITPPEVMTPRTKQSLLYRLSPSNSVVRLTPSSERFNVEESINSIENVDLIQDLRPSGREKINLREDLGTDRFSNVSEMTSDNTLIQPAKSSRPRRESCFKILFSCFR